ncbi:MAG: hypothetical protein IJP03_02525 [Christensenellaceae bacterium]|nr:hypothetical protein [Christensenellaceae bacterium]
MNTPQNQTIKCQIESCAHNSPDHFCRLNCICVHPCKPCDCDSVTHRSESMCANFRYKEREIFHADD